MSSPVPACIACNAPIKKQAASMPCSMCGRTMHYECGVAHFTSYNARQMEWFKRVYQFRLIFHYGSYMISLCPACNNVLRTQFMDPMIRRLELTARHEELAQLYEDFGYLAEAGAVRNRRNQQVVRNINVDVNGLIDQISSGALNVPYKCPSCGASLSIQVDNGENGVRFCKYCGTAINTELVSNVIKQALK